MFLNIVNPNVKKRDKLKQIINNYNKDKIPNKNINITLDGSYCKEYNNSKTECIFINYCRDNYKNKIIDKKNIEHFYFITFNTMNPQLTNMNEITENKIEILNKMFHIEDFNYKVNNDGYIYIIMNNLLGNFLSNIKITDIYNKLLSLITIINKYTQRKIYIRPHLKDIECKRLDIYQKIKNLFKNVYIDINQKINMDNIYCVFIQNTKFMFHFASMGIPIYNLNVINYNYFPEIYINDISIINNLSENINTLPSIKDFMYKYYKFIYTEEDLEHPDFLNKLVQDYQNFISK